MRSQNLVLTLFALASLSLAVAPPASAQSLQHRAPAKSDALVRQTAAPSGRIVIKFTEDSHLVVKEEGLSGGHPADLARCRALLEGSSRRAPFSRRFDQSFEQLDNLRQSGQNKARRFLPNLNAYGVLDYSVANLGRDELLDILQTILADPAVETAFLEPRAVPAALGFDAFTGVYTAPAGDPTDEAIRPAGNRDTPDFILHQGYLLAPPAGVNAMAVADRPGARGGDVKLVDIELGWNFGHEDLPAPFFTFGNINGTLDNRNHGTAVMGEIRGTDNGFGVRGIAPDVQVGASSAASASVAGAIMNGWLAETTGDVLLIELHAPGPNADGNGQFGYVPMEYWQDNFDTILTVTANGGVICEAAGNGSQNLDDPVYGLLFDRDWRDSGAIMCGAATSNGTPFSWSNNGTRVDLNGWGGNVGSCGYGDLQGSPEVTEDQYYTGSFSGTSSASPIVTGSVIALQGLSKATYGFNLDALTIRTLLAATGTPHSAGGIVGPRPDILAAFNQLEWGLGEVSGTVTDAETGQPISGAEVTVSGWNQTTVTDAEGGFFLVTNVGVQDITFSQFFYQQTTGSSEIVFNDPATLNITMTRLPTVDIKAVVRTDDGAPLTTARVTTLNAPLVAESLPGTQSFLLAGAPIGLPLELRIDNEPGYGVDFVAMTPAASSTGFNIIYPELATAAHDFELWSYNYTSVNGDWSWGTPADTPTAFSGDRCWGVGMDGNYPNGANDYLTSGSYNLNGHTETYLALHYWSDMQDGVDGVNLQIQSYNDEWIDIEPLGGYSHELITTLGNKPGWSGHSGGWQGAVFDIQQYTDLLIRFRFKFYSDPTVSGGGFFIDDVTFDTGNSLSPVQDFEVTPAPRQVGLNAHPNPFNPQTTIAWEISRPGPLAIKVFDTRGRLVKTLVDEYSSEVRGSTTWDGRNGRGEALASGTYLVQLKDGSGQSSTRRVTMVK